MRGLLADANLDGQIEYIRSVLSAFDLSTLLSDSGLVLATFDDLKFARNINDRELWNACQELGWVLFTDNRNHAGSDSLEAVLRDSWCVGRLPVITLASKRRFDRNRTYARRTAIDLADLLFGLANQEYRDIPRIFVPR